MRPVRLEIKGFMAFRDPVVVDFTDLDLFALWGQTGSGKSSVLDAMTYALYGKAERVQGSRVPLTELISQGQPSMTAMLEFSVGGGTYRATRRTQRSGKNSMCRLDQLVGNEWITRADKVGAMNSTIFEIVGLDYDAFTRSVILPQGKFAEFLTGDARTRREILTELLGLGLFEEMSKRANAVSKEAKQGAEIKSQVIADQFANATPESLSEAHGRAKTASKLAKSAERLQDALESYLQRAGELDSRVTALDRCMLEAREFADRHRQASSQVEALLNEAGGVSVAAAAAKKQVKVFVATAEATRTAFIDAQERFGGVEELIGLRNLIVRLHERMIDAESAEKLAVEADEGVDAARAKLNDARATIATRSDQERKAAESLEEAQRLFHEAHRLDLVGTLVRDLEPGAPCPVCERPLEQLPESAAGDLKDHDRARSSAENTLTRVREQLGAARIAAAAAESALDAAATHQGAARSAALQAAKSAKAARKAVTDAMGEELPDDLEDEVARRLDHVRALTEAVSTAEEQARSAEKEASQAAARQEAIQSQIAQVVAVVHSLPVERLASEIAELLPQTGVLQDARAAARSEATVDCVETRSRLLRSVAAGLEEAIERSDRERSELLAKAREIVPAELEITGDDVESMVRSVRVVCLTLTERAAKLGAEAEALAEDIKRRKMLEKDVAGLNEEHALFHSLHLELRSNRIVDYLQAEALAMLADAGSARLHELSGDRYRLEYDDDEFFVVDAWNGEERRSVRTLSGGETFLASLAFALALSDQVQLLAVTEKHRMESLFLDEGFGTLDAETLEMVVSAIEQLGTEDRLVGVITHVTELAARLPVRIEVTKSPRGSRLHLMTTDLTPLDHASQRYEPTAV